MASLFDNLSLKIVALLLGLLLWFHVATEKTYVYEVLLPVTSINLEADLSLVRYPVDSLQVVVSASGKQLMRSKWREKGLRINATQFAPGRHQLTLSPANTSLVGGNNLISLDEIITPVGLELYVDRRSEVTLPVEADLVAVADDGFAVASISRPEPAQVKVSGPRSLLGGFSIIFTEHKKMTGLRNSLEITLPLTAPVGHGITLDPDSVTLKVRVVPVRTRVFNNVPVVLYNAPGDLRTAIRPRLVTVILTGPPEEIDKLEASALVVSADYTKLDSFGRAALKVDCPTTFRVKSVSVDSVAIDRL